MLLSVITTGQCVCVEGMVVAGENTFLYFFIHSYLKPISYLNFILTIMVYKKYLGSF